MRPENLLADLRWAVLDIVADDVVDADRCHAYPPAQLVTPCLFIDAATVYPHQRGVEVHVPLFVAFDGAVEAYEPDRDWVTSRTWDILSDLDGLTITAATPGSIDVGGASAPSVRFDLTYVAPVTTLCPETMHLADAAATTP